MPAAGEDGRRVVGDEHLVRGGQGDCARHRHAVDRKADMDCPVRAPLAELARAVERIDHPDPVRVAAAGVVGHFLREDEVVGACRLDPRDDQGIRFRIPAPLQVGIGAVPGGAQVAQQGCGLKRDRAGHVGVGLRRMGQRSGLQTPMICSTIRSAAASGVSRVVSTRISARSGVSYGLEMPVKWAISPARALA